VPAGTRLVIVEGNYLLLGQPPWTEVRGFLDEVWWVDLPAAQRRSRLVARHVRWGKTAEAAERFVTVSDEANARAVAPGRALADLIVTAG
jgi:pantothenate kinase